MAALRGAEHVSRAANLQVAHRDFESGAERRVLLDRVDALARRAFGHHLARQHQVGVGLHLRAAHAAAQLVQIGEPEAVRAVDDDRIGIRNIEPALDDRRRDQHIGLPIHETLHHLLEFILVHLAVADLDPRAGA